jgi:hypothetical protein
LDKKWVELQFGPFFTHFVSFIHTFLAIFTHFWPFIHTFLAIYSHILGHFFQTHLASLIGSHSRVGAAEASTAACSKALLGLFLHSVTLLRHPLSQNSHLMLLFIIFQLCGLCRVFCNYNEMP